MTLSGLLSERAKTNRKKTYIKFEDRKMLYSEIDRFVDLCAGGLKSLGLKPQERAAILMENCPEYIISYFSILRAGCVVIPVNTLLTPGEISYILNDSSCKVLIYSSSFVQHIEKIRESIPDLRAVTYDEIPRQESVHDDVSEEDVAVFLYTSGTTGFPKGAMLTHKNLLSNAEASAAALHVTGKDRFLLFLPLFHSFSFTACVLVPLYSGATIILLKSVKPFSKVINSIFKDRITLFAGVPTIYNILSKKKLPFLLKFVLKFLIKIRACISGAAALPESTLQAFEERFDVPLIEGYGLTEASPVVAVNPLKGIRKPASVGFPVPGVEVSVVGEKGEELPAGGIGELIVKGPNVMKGYFNKEEDTKAVIKEGWLYTGDMAKIDEDGYVYIVDRKKDLIIVDGMNIYPREVEEFVLSNPSVEECAMVGIPDGRGSEISVLFIKQKENMVVDEREVSNNFKGRMANYKIPRRIIIVDELPRTATVKIKKVELRKWKL